MKNVKGCIAITALLAALLPVPALAQLKIVIMDCGQGNAAFVQAPSGEACIIDAGAGANGWGTSTFLPFIRDTTNFGKTKLTHLNYTFIGHYHADHIYGMDEVINGLTRDSILGGCWDRGGTYSSTAFTNYTTAAGTKRATNSLGNVLNLGPIVTLKCVCMNAQVLGKTWTGSTADENNMSMGILLTYGNFKMIFATDIGGQRSGSYDSIERVLAPVVGKVNVLLVDHHGAATSTCYKWVTALDPQASIISCGGPTNSYSHPRQTVIDTLLMDPKLGGSKSRGGDSNYIYQTETTTGYGVIPAGRGRAVDKNIWIRVFPSYYVVVGDIPKDTVMFSSLAVELSQFAAQQAGGGIELSWRTESENGCYQWRIERSADQESGYQPIDTIPGYGTTDQPHDYAYRDRSLTVAGQYWYRLAETDLSGNTTYHGPVAATYGAQRDQAFCAATVFPNPARDAASIRYQLATPGSIELAVYNITGQRVKQVFDGPAAAGPSTATWDGRDEQGRRQPNGVYFFRLSRRDGAGANDQAIVKRLILAR